MQLFYIFIIQDSVEVAVKNDDGKGLTFNVTFKKTKNNELSLAWLKNIGPEFFDHEKNSESLKALNVILNMAPISVLHSVSVRNYKYCLISEKNSIFSIIFLIYVTYFLVRRFALYNAKSAPRICSRSWRRNGVLGWFISICSSRVETSIKR